MIQMLRTVRGSPDGLQTCVYHEGEDYSRTSQPPVSEDLERVFLQEGWAKRMDPQVSAERKVVNPTQVDVDQFHTGGGWYELPGLDRKVRKAEALEHLQ